jgi:hypothetical protein
MDIDDRLRDLDRAQLLKLGTAALFAATAGALAEGKADAAAHAMGRSGLVPVGLDYQVRGYGAHATLQKTRMGKELRRVRVTTDKSRTHGATMVHELDNAEVQGTDEEGRRHSHEFNNAPLYIGLWIE